MSDKFEITPLTFAFAQNEEDTFIITNEQGLTFRNLDIHRDMGAMINTERKTISPKLPIGVLSKYVFPWKKPTKKVDFEEVKKYKQLGQS